MQSTENIWIYLWNEFIFVSFICSSISVLIFILLYNFNFKFLKNRILNTLLLVIVLFAGFIHIWQIIELKGIFLNSCVLDNIGDLVPPVAVFWYRRFTLSDFSYRLSGTAPESVL